MAIMPKFMVAVAVIKVGQRGKAPSSREFSEKVVD